MKYRSSIAGDESNLVNYNIQKFVNLVCSLGKLGYDRKNVLIMYQHTVLLQEQRKMLTNQIDNMKNELKNLRSEKLAWAELLHFRKTILKSFSYIVN